MIERLVIVELVDGIADTRIVHHPATVKRFGGEGQIECRFDNRTFPPVHWPSACGQVPKGSVYNHAGMLEDAPICVDCQVAMRVGEA